MNKLEELLNRVRDMDEKFSDAEQADAIDAWTELMALNKKMASGKVDQKEVERMFVLSNKVAAAAKKQSKQQNKEMLGN